MRRAECGACGHEELVRFLDLGRSPVADAYTTRPNELLPTYPLQVAVCTACWLVQLLDVLPNELLFGTGYSFYSSASPPLSVYHEAYAGELLRDHFDLARFLTVEVGCNDGDFLRHFAAAGCRAVGVDPALGPVMAARDRGLDVVDEPFGQKVAARLRGEYGPAGIIVANHVLAHVESVADTLAGVAELLRDDGVAYIEVQYLPDLLVNNAFDLVYHEHRNFFSLTSLATALARWGLYVMDARFTKRQGGSLRIVATRRRPRRVPRSASESEAWLRSISTYRGFQGRAERIRDRLLDILDAMDSVIGYGAPAKATTLLNFCGIDVDQVKVIIDTTPAKQGRHIPGTAIPVIPPEDADLRSVQAMLLLAWNYAGDILRRHISYTAEGGRWIVPIPAPMLL